MQKKDPMTLHIILPRDFVKTWLDEMDPVNVEGVGGERGYVN